MGCKNYGRTMSQKLPVSRFKWVEDLSELNEDFIKNYNEKSGEGHFLEVDIQCPENLRELHSDLPFLPETKKLIKSKKLQLNFVIKTNLHIQNLKQSLNHGLLLKKVNKVIKCNQKNLHKTICWYEYRTKKKSKKLF